MRWNSSRGFRFTWWRWVGYLWLLFDWMWYFLSFSCPCLHFVGSGCCLVCDCIFFQSWLGRNFGQIGHLSDGGMKPSVYVKVVKILNQKFQKKCHRLRRLRLSKRKVKKLMVMLLHKKVMSLSLCVVVLMSCNCPHWIESDFPFVFVLEVMLRLQSQRLLFTLMAPWKLLSVQHQVAIFYIVLLHWYVFFQQWLLLMWGPENLDGADLDALEDEEFMKVLSDMMLKLFGMLK